MISKHLLFCLLACGFAPAVSGIEPEAGKAPAEVFTRHCAGCHGRAGTGNTFPGLLMFAPNFTRPAWQARNTDEQIQQVIAKGRRMMPAFEKKLSSAEITQMVRYVRQLKKP